MKWPAEIEPSAFDFFGLLGFQHFGHNGFSEDMMIQDKDKEILRIFAEKVRQKFPEARIWAFGSRARGDAVAESDLDVCVVIDNLDEEKWETISDIAWEVGFENDVLISTVKFSREAFEQGPPSESPLVMNIYREGVPA